MLEEWQTGYEIIDEWFGIFLDGYILIGAPILIMGVYLFISGYRNSSGADKDEPQFSDFAGSMGFLIGSLLVSIGFYPEIQEFFQNLRPPV